MKSNRFIRYVCLASACLAVMLSSAGLFRRKGEGMDEGYQSPPVNWGISSERKRSFFNLVSEITAAAK
jgi:hypothetical protein